MKEIGIEKNNTVFSIGNNHFPTIVFGEEFPNALIPFFVNWVIGGKRPVQWSFLLVYDQTTIVGVSIC